MPTLRDYINAELDRSYTRTAGGMLKAITNLSTAPGTRIQARLKALDEEAARLAEAGERMGIDNAELAATLGETEQLFTQAESVVMANDNQIQESGLQLANIAALATVGLILSPRISAGINPLSAQAQKRYTDLLTAAGVNWQTADSDVLRALVKYIDSDAWIAKMEGWGTGYAELIRDSIYNGIGRGRSPIGISRDIRHLIQNMPSYAAERLTRTLQLTAFRDAEAASSYTNETVIQQKVRRAVKDHRTCLSCIALDGTRLAPNERIDDHYKGRCFVTYILQNGMGDTDPTTGEDWFKSLPEERQAQQASFVHNSAKYNAWKAGEFNLRDLSGEHNDPVFGRMTFEKSLKAILGERAKEFYGQ